MQNNNYNNKLLLNNNSSSNSVVVVCRPTCVSSRIIMVKYSNIYQYSIMLFYVRHGKV